MQRLSSRLDGSLAHVVQGVGNSRVYVPVGYHGDVRIDSFHGDFSLSVCGGADVAAGSLDARCPRQGLGRSELLWVRQVCLLCLSFLLGVPLCGLSCAPFREPSLLLLKQ